MPIGILIKMKTAFVPIYTEEELLKKIRKVDNILLKTQEEVLQSKYSDGSYTFRYIWCEYELTKYIVSDFLQGEDTFKWYKRLWVEKEVEEDYAFPLTQPDTLHNSLIALSFTYSQYKSVVSKHFDYQYIEDGRDAVTFIITDIFVKLNPSKDSDYRLLKEILNDLNYTYIRSKDDYNEDDEITWERMFDYVNAYYEHQEYQLKELKNRLDLVEEN